MKTGDAIATVAQPIARGIDTVFGTDLRNCPKCNRMKNNLNNGMNLADAFYDRFWKPKEKNDGLRQNTNNDNP